MRIITLAAVAALTALPSLAGAAEPTVNVAIGEKLDRKADKYGERELAGLADDLREAVLRETGRTGALQDATIELVIEDAVPNRPTLQQMADKPGLSFESYGVGGAKITGVVTTADGRSFPVSYAWYETDIRWASVSGTWSDARQTFSRVARDLVRD